ncbi:MAG: hypothetical protein IPO36_09255 [Anaerolineales bacterium]|nr:hypothetical protein [Anaerolineales bacterium]
MTLLFHGLPLSSPATAVGIRTPSTHIPDAYDADDYARDAADDLANPETGNGITIFTIGLGTARPEQIQACKVPTYPDGSLLQADYTCVPTGENLLAYIAKKQAMFTTQLPGYSPAPPITANITLQKIRVSISDRSSSPSLAISLQESVNNKCKTGSIIPQTRVAL